MFDCSNDGSDSKYRQRQTKKPTLCVPWIQLLMTCNFINTDLSEYMDATTTSVHSTKGARYNGNRTYQIDICGSKHQLDSAAWRKIPCSPATCHELVVNFHVLSGERKGFNGDGGPMNSVLELHQMLNRLLHHGPLLNRPDTLPQSMRLQGIEIHLTYPQSLKRRAQDAGEQHPFFRFANSTRNLYYWIRMPCSSGLLSSHVEHVEVRDAYWSHFTSVEHRLDAQVPQLWVLYGYNWGPATPPLSWISDGAEDLRPSSG